MNLLAIETTSNACSVALQQGDTVTERHVEEARVHTRILVPTIRELLSEQDVAFSDLQAVVLGNGPGSFIGMRIGGSVAQGIAHAAGIGIVPVSSLAAIATDVFGATDAETVAVTQDARMDEVYVGIFRRGESDLPALVDAETIVSSTSLSVEGAPHAAGAGWAKYPVMAANNDITDVSDRFALPRAASLLPLAVDNLDKGGAIDPDLLQPAYLRTQVATPPKA